MRKCVAGNRAVCQDCPLANQKRGCPQDMRLLTNHSRGMSLGEARHADQLVVRGGASITSDSDHGLVRLKATTSTTTNHYPGSWAYLGMTFLLLTFMSCHPVLGIEGDIFPANGIIEVGTNLNFTCTLRNESGADVEMPSARDIVWYKGADMIPPDYYHIVNETVSSISIVNATLNDSATYYCALNQDTDISEYLRSTLQVGYKPQPATSLTCSSNNVYDYSCEWVPVLTHIANETHKFQLNFKGTWKDCPDLVSETKCFVNRNEHTGSNQQVRVVSSNDLGDDAKKDLNFNPEKKTIPLAPENLVVSASSSTVLFATWDAPPKLEDFQYSFLTYRLHWASQYNPQEWLGELTCDHEGYTKHVSCDIRQLDPYTEYVVKVSCHYTNNEDNAWGDWSEPAVGRTDEAVPNGRVQDLQSSNLNGTGDYDRNVLISWQVVPEREQRGLILGYSVTVTPDSSCREQNIIDDTVNGTEVIVEGLEKFCSYTVMITAFNSVGSGPEEDEKIPDMTTNPLPPSVVEAETLSHQSVLVTWNKPTPAKGYISYYTVYWIKTRGQDIGQSRQVNASSLSYTVECLEGYVLYSFKVSVTNRIGISGWSREAQTMTDEWIPEASPTNVTVEPITDNPNSLLVSWIDVSEEDAHGQIQGYHLYYCPVAEESLSLPLCSLDISGCLEKQERATFYEPLQKPVTLDSLAPFTHYLTWISAFTSVGEGPRSECPSSGRTSEGPPSQPLNVSVTGLNSTSIGLTWSPPLEKNGIIRNYKILVKSNASTEQQEFYSGGAQSYLVEGLYGYIRYTIQVLACTTTCGAASDEVYQHTDIGVPEQPVNLNVITANNIVTLSWDPPVHPNGPIDHYRVSYRHTEESTTPSPVVVNVRSASATISFANSIDEWIMTTELTKEMEVDCSQAPFLFQVVAVNVVEGSLLVGVAAESVLSECIALETTLSPLLWLILPCGAILLFALSVSLWYVQSKLGKSWPDPVYTDMVKNKKDMHPIPRPKRVEKEEFDAIQIDCPPDLSEVTVAEEFPMQPYHCNMQTTGSDPLTNSIDIKRDIGGKQAYLRTVSIDSGVPPSPQDHLDFSSSEDVFDPDCDGAIWPHDTYSFGNPKVMFSHTGFGGGHLPKRSVSLSSSDGYGVLPVIEENKCMDPIMEKISGGKVAIAIVAPSSTNADDYDDDDDEDDMDEVNYTRISKLSSPQRQPTGAFKEPQGSSMNQNKCDSPEVDYVTASNDQTISSHDSGDSGYIRNDLPYMKFALNEITEETTFKSEPDDDYVPGPLTYSVLAVPQVGEGELAGSQVGQEEQSLTSSYVSEENLAYTKLGMTPDGTGKEIVQSSPSTVALVEPPSSKSESIGYVKLGKDSPAEDIAEEQAKSSWNDMSDYVRGVDLHKMLGNECKLSASSPISNQGDIAKVESQDFQDLTLDVTKGKKSRKPAVRSRTDSSSSSSGYGSDNRGQVSGYVVVSNQPKEHTDNYANLAFTSSESETDSDVDIRSEKIMLPKDEHEKDCLESKDCDTSYVEYISNDGFGLGFVNDYPRPDPSEKKDYIEFSDSVSPCLQTKEASSFPEDHQQGGCKIIPGYVSHNAVLGADMGGIVTPGVERLSSPATLNGTSKPDIYQVPSKGCRELQSNSSGLKTTKDDDGYVPFGGDDGYVLRVLDGTETKEEYTPMSPIRKARIEEDCL